MKNLIPCFLLILISKGLFAQNLDQVSVFGGSNEIVATGVDTDQFNNSYTLGYFGGIGDFDPGSGGFNLTSMGTTDVFVSKTNEQGEFVWAKQLGGSGSIYSTQISVDGLGNVYVSGFFNNSIDFNPGSESFDIISNGNFDSFILKLDTDGNFIWAKGFGGAERDRNQAIEVDSSGNVYATGIFNLTVDFDAEGDGFQLTSMGGDYDVYIAKYSTDGDLIWAKQIGGTGNVLSHDIAIDDSGNVYSTGHYGNGSPDFDPGDESFSLGTGGFDIMYISKLDALGDFVWAKQVFGNINHGNSIAVKGNDLVVSGYFLGLQDFDPGVGTFEMESVSLFDAYVLKLDIDGNFNWAKQMGGTGRDESLAVQIDVNGSIVHHGVFEGTANFDPTGSNFSLTSLGTHDVFVSKLDPSGSLLWISQIGGNGLEHAADLALDGNNAVLLAGHFFESTDFDPSPSETSITSLGQSDAFMLKLQNTPLAISENEIPQYQIYPNPFNNFITIELGESYNEVQIQVFNFLGQEVESKNLSTTGTLNLNIKGPSGVYFVHISSHVGPSTTKRILKI